MHHPLAAEKNHVSAVVAGADYVVGLNPPCESPL